MTAINPFSVAKELNGCSWCLTGGAGFVGGVLIEHLLRECKPSKIVLLVRSKRGVKPFERVEKLLSRPLYDTVRKQYGSTAALLERFEVVEQDLTCPKGWALPAVDVVVHAAASISFTNHIHEAISDNYLATQNMANAAAKMPGLKAFVQISTCYVNDNNPKGTHIADKVYPLELEGKAVEHSSLVKELLGMPYDSAEAKAQRILAATTLPNNYSLTKRLAEFMLLDKKKEGLPVAILRTSIIGSTSQHHIVPGYIGNGSGPVPLFIAIGYGMWTCTEWKAEHVDDVIPVDCVTSSIIVAAAHTAANKDTPILQCASSESNPMTTDAFYQAALKRSKKEPAPFTVFSGFPKPNFSDIYCSTKEEYERRLAKADRTVRIRCFLLTLVGHGKAAKGLKDRWENFKLMGAIEYDFDLYFTNDNLAALHAALSPEEQSKFNCLWRKGVDSWDTYLDVYVGGVWERYVNPARQTAAKKEHQNFTLCGLVRVKRTESKNIDSLASLKQLVTSTKNLMPEGQAEAENM